jgi:hypothetical protein
LFVFIFILKKETMRKQSILTVLPAISAGMASRRISSAGKFQLDGKKERVDIGDNKNGVSD